jgi:hypothetical protein
VPRHRRVRKPTCLQLCCTCALSCSNFASSPGGWLLSASFVTAGIMTILKTDSNPGLQVYYQGAAHDCMTHSACVPYSTCSPQHRLART